jgi:hypothetical protein
LQSGLPNREALASLDKGRRSPDLDEIAGSSRIEVHCASRRYRAHSYPRKERTRSIAMYTIALSFKSFA